MSVEIEKQLSRKEIYDGHIIHVCVDQIDLAGKKKIREVVLHSGASAIVPVTQNGGIIFVKQYRYPVQQALLEIPAGKMDPGETLIQAIERECQEEMGSMPNYLRLVPIEKFTSSDNGFVYHTFFCLLLEHDNM